MNSSTLQYSPITALMSFFPTIYPSMFSARIFFILQKQSSLVVGIKRMEFNGAIIDTYHFIQHMGVCAPPISMPIFILFRVLCILCISSFHFISTLISNKHCPMIWIFTQWACCNSFFHTPALTQNLFP